MKDLPFINKALYQVLGMQKFSDVFKSQLFNGKNSLYLVGNMKLKTYILHNDLS